MICPIRGSLSTFDRKGHNNPILTTMFFRPLMLRIRRMRNPLRVFFDFVENSLISALRPMLGSESIQMPKNNISNCDFLQIFRIFKCDFMILDFGEYNGDYGCVVWDAYHLSLVSGGHISIRYDKLTKRRNLFFPIFL